jgi:hypothetical protein
MWEVIIPAVATLMTSVMAGLFALEVRNRNARDKHNEAREKMREEESLLAMKLMSANTNLGIATGMAVRDGRTNGGMTDALKEAEQAKKEYYAFINRVATHQIAAE